MVDPVYASVRELAVAYRAGVLSPTDVVRAHLDRIAQFDGYLRAYITVTADLALRHARQAECELKAGRDRGPLHGVPFAVKDQVLTKGIRTTAASLILKDWIPDTDATAVVRMRGAGAILLGKLNMMEWALGRPKQYAFGTPRNPWNPAHETGGSSSGCGSALAAGMATLTIGEDTGGSARHPAAHCGVVGLRPTWGLVSRYGMLPAVWQLDTLGPMARSVEDAAHVLQAIAGPDPSDPDTLVGPIPNYPAELKGGLAGVRVGVVKELLPGPGLAPAAAEAVTKAVRLMEDLGAVADEVSIPLAPHAGAIYTAFGEPQAALVHLPLLRKATDLYDPNVRIRLGRGLVIPAVVARWADRVGRRALRRQILEVLESHDVLIAPTTADSAPQLDDAHANRPKTRKDLLAEFGLQAYRMPFSLFGGPALALCCAFDAHGLPLSLQIVGAPGHDSMVLRVGHAYQQATDWHLRRPQLI